MRSLATLASFLFVLPLAGCPAGTADPYGRAPAKNEAPKVGADDPRVAVKDGELYTQRTVTRAEERSRDAKPSANLGSGRPDETNGKCRLFAPELPDPECCAAELGFDVDTVKQACGYGVYLGESFRSSCGHYFMHDQGYRWIRISQIPETTAEAAAEHHDRKLRETLGDKYQLSTPIPGVKGAMWSRHEQYRWAFIPGWDHVRQLSWNADSCTDEGIVKVIAQIQAAKPPPPGAERLGLIPKARM